MSCLWFPLTTTQPDMPGCHVDRRQVKLSKGGTLRNAHSTGFLKINDEIRLLACETWCTTVFTR